MTVYSLCKIFNINCSRVSGLVQLQAALESWAEGGGHGGGGEAVEYNHNIIVVGVCRFLEHNEKLFSLKNK